MMNIGINSFAPKFKLTRDFDGVLTALKEKGITSVEPCVIFHDNNPDKAPDFKISAEVLAMMAGGIWDVNDAAAQLAAVRAHGFTVVSCHMMLGFQFTAERLVELLPVILDFGRANHITYFVVSPMKGLDVVRPMVPLFNQVADALKEAGMTLLLHTHATEFMEEEGTTVVHYLMEHCPNLGLELDVGWAKFAGADSVAYMRRYGSRIPLLHFKDVAEGATMDRKETYLIAVGEGSIPLKEIMAEAPNCALIEHGLIIDQDDSLADIVEDLGRGAENIRAAAQ